jgi:hypothetical protein
LPGGDRSFRREMTEYQVVYTINGEGYTNDLPWIDTRTDDLEEAKSILKILKAANDSFSKMHEEWIEVRQVTSWSRLDLGN